MANKGLEAPPGRDPDWGELYLARGSDVPKCRPIYTGDVFSEVTLRTTSGQEKKCLVAVLQHPCSMRRGRTLRERLLVAKLRPFQPLPRDQWHTNERLMPLPQLRPELSSNRAHQAVFFEDPYVVDSNELNVLNRLACLSEFGGHLLLQRWMFYSSRLAVPTWQIAQVNEHVYQEAELVETWCEAAIEHGITLTEAEADVDNWLSESVGDSSRRQMLQEVGLRSQVRREMRKELKARNYFTG